MLRGSPRFTSPGLCLTSCDRAPDRAALLLGRTVPQPRTLCLWGGVVKKTIGVWGKHSPIGLGAEWAAHDCKSNGCGSPCAPGLALGLGVSSAAVRSHGNTKTPRGNLLPGAGGCGWAGARPPWVLGSRWRRRGGGAGRAHVRGRGCVCHAAALGPWAAVRPLPQPPLAQRRSVLRRAVAASC